MKLSIGCDHGGFALKEQLKELLQKAGHELIDCGTFGLDSCDYPTFAFKAAALVASGECARGILVCTSGEGISIAANKVKGIRCGLVYNSEVARLIVEHNNCNMMALGAKFITPEEGREWTEIFLATEFAGGRHGRRVDLITDYEDKHC